MYTSSGYGIHGVSAHARVSAYARVGLETGVFAANPHKLILMLFEGARIALSSALIHMRNGAIAPKGEAILKAITIISSGLQASLDDKAGGELAQQLHGLYDYMSRRLLQANLHNKPEYIEEVARLLGELNEAWVAIGSPPSPHPGAQAVGLAAGYGGV